jgi:uncharacterized damage-inducible protein DinB
MKDILKAFGRYNQGVNGTLLGLLETLGREKLMMETKAYYPSVFETLLHIFIADLNWLRRYKDVFTESTALRKSGLLLLEEKGLRKELESDYSKLFRYRREADELINQFLSELDESKLDTMIRYKNYRGVEIEKESWKTLFHWLNHQTHHRGQISVLLDMMGVENDYSSMMAQI